jgi:hypothetical protein
MLQVITHELPAHTSQRFLYGRDLHEHVRAVAILFDHTLQAADLPLDASQTLDVPIAHLRIHGDRFPATCAAAA